MIKILLTAVVAFISITSQGQVKDERTNKGRIIDSVETARIVDSLVKLGITDKDLEEMYNIESKKKHPDQEKLYKLNSLKLSYLLTVGLAQIDRDNTDKTRIARTFHFDAEATNFERFRTSPCYDKLGFNPLGDLKELEREYVECEKQHYIDTSYTVLKYLGMTCLIVAIVYFGIRKSK